MCKKIILFVEDSLVFDKNNRFIGSLTGEADLYEDPNTSYNGVRQLLKDGITVDDIIMLRKEGII